VRLQVNHSSQAFGMSEKQQRSTMRAFGIVLGICMSKGRYACNSYTLSKSLLQRLLKQELPRGILPLCEEFPDAFKVSRKGLLRVMRRLMQLSSAAAAAAGGSPRSLGHWRAGCLPV